MVVKSIATRIETKSFSSHSLSKTTDLASSASGSVVVKASDGFFATASSFLHPIPSHETNIEDWCIIKLGSPGNIVGFDIDISHSSLQLVSVEGAFDPDCNGHEEEMQWTTLLDRVELTALDHNIFAIDSNSVIPCTHIRVKQHSYGYIEHFRVYGHRELEIPRQSLSEPNIQAELLTSERYAPYGDVIESRSLDQITSANQGTAEKYHQVASVTNSFPKENGKMNLCVYHCRPAKELPFTVKLLERHPFSSQAFIPMTDGETRAYLVIVALNGADDRPDLSTLKAFVANTKQGINYRQGVWHHPMVVLEHTTDFACIVHESGVPEDDCHEVDVTHTLVHVPGF